MAGWSVRTPPRFREHAPPVRATRRPAARGALQTLGIDPEEAAARRRAEVGMEEAEAPDDPPPSDD